MLKIKDIISMIKDLYKSNLMIENPIDVILTMGIFSFLCNFLSKVGLFFIAISGTLFLLDVSTGIVLLTLFIPSIIVLSNLPIVYVKNIIKGIKQYKNENKINEVKDYENSSPKLTNNNINNNNYFNYNICKKNSIMVRIRKK